MTRTTPPRPADIAAIFPELAPLARTATRLHPRPGAPTPHDSSVGGPLLWPTAEPWPYCDGRHRTSPLLPPSSPGNVRRVRAIQAAARNRSRGDLSYTPQERAEMARIAAGRACPAGPVAMLALAQLYARDVPALRPPGRADLLQVLWCPFDHVSQDIPRTALFWRSATEVADILTAPPEPAAVQYDDYVPEPCLVDPEQITEYPAAMELDEDLRARVAEWSARQKADAAPGSVYDGAEEAFYDLELSVSPGWKVGGWIPWSTTDPCPQYCSACGSRMEPLLSIASDEWQPDVGSWIPYEDRAAASHTADPDPARPTRVGIHGYDLNVLACPATPEHPHAELLQ
jgi:hypothetical protein